MSDRSLDVVMNHSEASIGQIIEHLPVWVQVCDLDGTVISVNQAATEISGYERDELVGQNWPYVWLFEPGSESSELQAWGAAGWPIAELNSQGYVAEFEATCTTNQGKRRCLSVTLSLLQDDQGNAKSVLMSAWDYTDRKTREADLGQAQKMQALGQLASGIAHDINNNLAVILGYAEFLLCTSESFGDVVRQALSAIQEQSLDCANTVRRIQMFSRSVPKSQFSSFPLNDLIHDVIKSNEEEWKVQLQTSGIDIRVVTDLVSMPDIYAYEAGLKEAMSSLVTNAVEALPHGGEISFRTRVSGEEVLLEVGDNGGGITPEIMDRIFDAFFTTKGPASSGLGLSIAYNLITQQGGKISVDSEEGKGTTVTISLPYHVSESDAMPVTDDTPNQKSLSVLVVDDEPMVANVFRAFLEASGNHVVTCLDGSSALAAFEEQKFDLALVDLGMPLMDGWEVTKRINGMRPEFPIILATGWNVSVDEGLERGAQVKSVLRKPFGMQELSSAINQALL